MKFLHLADLHFGKTLHNQPQLEDQAFWVDRMLEAVDREKPEAVLIAGDVYDRGVPGKEAVQLLSRMITALADKGVELMLTAGNHDGGERLEFAADLLANQRVHIAGTLRREMVHVTLRDSEGPVTFWLMPYTTPAAVRTVFEMTEDEVGSYTQAVTALLAQQPIDFAQRNVLIGHQTVLWEKNSPIHSDSESAIGGVGGVEVSAFQGFDYVALGHIHGAQAVGAPHIRYAGAPLCYHFSEAGQKKGLHWVTLGPKGEAAQIRIEPVKPLHRVAPTITGELEEILAGEQAHPTSDAYIRVELTDEHIIPNTHETLSAVFASHGSRLLDLCRAPRQYTGFSVQEQSQTGSRSLAEYFCDFYRSRNPDCRDPEPEELELIQLLARQIEDRPDEKEDVLTMEFAQAARKQAAGGMEQEAAQ